MNHDNLPLPLRETLENLSLFPDRSEKIQYLIEIADQFQQVPDDIAQKPYEESKRVPGCESEVFVFVNLINNKLKIEFAVDNPQGISAMTIAQLVKESLNNQAPEVAETFPEEVIFQVFGNELSMGKSMGLKNLISMVKSEAKKLSQTSA